MDREDLKHFQHLYALPEREGNARALDEIMGKLIEVHNMLEWLAYERMDDNGVSREETKRLILKSIKECKK